MGFHLVVVREFSHYAILIICAYEEAHLLLSDDSISQDNG